MAEKPAYQIMYESLREAIENKVYEEGSLLPTETELGKLYQVSRTTVRRAIYMLVQDDYVRVQQGYGTVVLPALKDRVFGKFRNVVDVTDGFYSLDAEDRPSIEKNITTQGMSVDKTIAPIHVAKALEVNFGETVYRVQRISYLNDVPFAFSNNYLRMDFFPDLEQFSGAIHNLYKILEDKYDTILTTGTETITARVADLVMAKLLEIEIGSPLLELCRHAYCKKGTMEYKEMLFRPDIYYVKVHMKRLPLSKNLIQM